MSLSHFPPARSARPAALAGALALLGALTLGACSSDDGPDAAPSSQASSDASGPVVLQPGKPGEPARTLDADAAAAKAEVAHDDVAFMQMMIPHHAQALTMSRLAPAQASSPAVKAMAARILAAQGPEIITMAGWLKAHDISVPRATDDPSSYDHGEHGHASMHGMLTDAELARLKAARGPAFDKLFLAGMIRHHEGAVEMADQVARKGSDVQVSEIAADVINGQSAEIDRMKKILAEL